VRSDHSRPPSSAVVVPARLPALDGARQRSKEDLRTDNNNSELNQPTATADQLGSVESIKMDGGRQTSGRLANVDGAPAWTREKLDDINANDETTETADEIPADDQNSKPASNTRGVFIQRNARNVRNERKKITQASTQYTQ